MSSNERAAGKGGIPRLLHPERAWPALPEHDCSALWNNHSDPAHMKILIIILLLASCLVAPVCGSQPSEGAFTNGVYYSKFFDFALPLPKGVVIATSFQNTNLVEIGKETLSQSNAELKATLDAAAARTVVLISASKFPLDSGKEGNWAINISAENLGGNPQITSGADYMKIAQSTLAASGRPYTFTPSSKSVVLGKVTFNEMIVKDDSPPSPTYFRMLFTIRKGYAVVIGITADEMSYIRELDDSFAKMTFK